MRTTSQLAIRNRCKNKTHSSLIIPDLNIYCVMSLIFLENNKIAESTEDITLSDRTEKGGDLAVQSMVSLRSSHSTDRLIGNDSPAIAMKEDEGALSL